MRGHLNELRSVENAVVYTDIRCDAHWNSAHIRRDRVQSSWMPHADGPVTMSDAYTNGDDTFSAAGVRGQF